MDKFTVRDSSGAVDVGASAKAYTDALTAWVAANESSTDEIAAAVMAVFDRFPGQVLPMPALLSLAVTELGVAPSEHAETSKRVHLHVRSLAGEGGSLTITKGKGGGVKRV